MTQRLTIGLPRMRAEVGERRDFLPDFVAMLIQAGADVVVEAGVGAGMGLDVDAYTQAAPGVIFGSHADAYAQDVVLVLRCPDDEDLRLMRPVPASCPCSTIILDRNGWLFCDNWM